MPLPTVTGVREVGGGRVAVEVDGSPWRAFPVDVVVRGGLGVGVALDRVRLRQLARAVRRERALAVAGRVLRHRDVSRRRLEERLEQAGVAPATRSEAVAALVRGGLVNDARLAASRARVLAERGYGDDAIRWRLEQERLAPELVEEAVAELEPEVVRARRLVAARGASARRAGWLARRGFAEETIESAFGTACGADIQDERASPDRPSA
jgi:SOS response regulatory protein OraA/RecX